MSEFDNDEADVAVMEPQACPRCGSRRSRFAFLFIDGTE